MPKDRGAEQGDVDGPLERRLVLGLVAAETRGRVAAQQALAPGLVLMTFGKQLRRVAKIQLSGLAKNSPELQ